MARTWATKRRGMTPGSAFPNRMRWVVRLTGTGLSTPRLITQRPPPQDRPVDRIGISPGTTHPPFDLSVKQLG